MSAKQRGFGAFELMLVFVAVGIVGFAGWFVWNGQKQSKVFKESNKNSNEVVATEKSTAINSTASQSTATYVDIKEWGVKFPMIDTIKAVIFRYDTSRSIFPGEAIIITAITNASGKQFTSYTTTSTVSDNNQNVDAICKTYGLGRSSNSSEINATTGLPYNLVAHVGNYYYYNVHASGGLCGQSDAATAATEATENMFKNLTAE